MSAHSPRVERLRALVRDLTEVAIVLADEASPTAAALFLERLARAEGYSQDDQALAGVVDLLCEASRLRAENLERLSHLAWKSLDLEQLQQTAHTLCMEDSSQESIMGWLTDVLFVANLQPWLEDAPRALTDDALDRCLSAIQAHPSCFPGAASLAASRTELEPSSEDAGRVYEVLEAYSESIMERLERSTVSEQVPAWAGDILRRVLESRVVRVSVRLRGPLEELRAAADSQGPALPPDAWETVHLEDEVALDIAQMPTDGGRSRLYLGVSVRGGKTLSPDPIRLTTEDGRELSGRLEYQIDTRAEMLLPSVLPLRIEIVDHGVLYQLEAEEL